ncbi:MAG: hypothetical protein ACLFP2_02300 [Candidatus Woesearchaeota archaeon]
MNIKIVPIIMILFLAGCQSLDAQCEPPARPMTDVNGNTVCVIASVVNDSINESDVIDLNETSNETSNDSVNDSVNDSEEDSLDDIANETVDDQTDSDVNETADNSGANVTDTSNESLSEEPVMTKTVTEGEIVSFNLSATDPDGDELTYSFSEPLGENGTWQTQAGDAGEYFAEISVSDGIDVVSKTVRIVVEPGNRPPVIESLSDISVTEGEVAEPRYEVSDPDGDEVTVSFTEPMDAGYWNTTIGDAGKYEVDVTASDGVETVTDSFTILVTAANMPPVISIENQTYDEGDLVVLEPEISDPDGDSLNVTYSGWMDQNTYQTTYDDAGVHLVTITVTDGTATVEKQVTITVEDVNRPPVFEIQ